MLNKNEVITVTFDGYTSDGLGVAHYDGEAVFAANAIAGETCSVRIVRAEKTKAYAKILEVQSPSSERVDPDCPYYGRCGGCDFRHMSYAEELRLKSQRVRDAITRIGGTDPGEVPILGADSPACYRNKSVFPVAQTENGPVAGYYRARTHEIIPITTCAIGAQAADLAREAVLYWMRDNDVPGYCEGKDGEVRHIFVRNGVESGQVQVCIMVQGKSLKASGKLAQYLIDAVPGLASVVLGFSSGRVNTIACERYKTIWGADTIDETLCGLSFRLSPASFFQINPPQAARLYQTALDLSELQPDETALDLYCGTGTITLLLSRRAGLAVGAEIVESAVRDAMENASRNGANNTRFLCADAGQAAAMLSREGLKPELVSVDPPRKGLSEDVVKTICEFAPTRIVYISCDPATLARDIARFREGGYELETVRAVDMFPRCAHVESVVRLRQNDIRTRIGAKEEP